MLNSYVGIIDQLKEELLSRTDEDYFVMGKDFMRFKFRTDDELMYNKVVNIPVFVISLRCVVKKGDIIHSLDYKKFFMKETIKNIDLFFFQYQY